MTRTGVAFSKADASSSAVSAEAVDKTEFSPQVPSKVLEKLPALSWWREARHMGLLQRGLFLLSE